MMTSQHKLVLGILVSGLCTALIVIGMIGYFAYTNLESHLLLANKEADQREVAAKIVSDGLTQTLNEEKEKNSALANDLAQTKTIAETQLQQLQDKLIEVQNSDDSGSVAAEWGEKVGFVYCVSENDSWSGSGTGAMLDDGSTIVLTNYHVVKGAEACSVSFPGDTTARYFVDKSDFFFDQSPLDWAIMFVDSPSFTLKNNLAEAPTCTAGSARIGDKLMILGYPGVGATSTITVTQGIVSGMDPNYFVTDAKIDHGNSGGAAILLKNNCFLGIPTAAVSGTLESYGRILDYNSIEKSYNP